MPVQQRPGEWSEGRVDDAFLGFVEQQRVMNHSPAALDVRVRMAGVSAPGGPRQQIAQADPAVDADGSVPEVGDGLFQA